MELASFRLAGVSTTVDGSCGATSAERLAAHAVYLSVGFLFRSRPSHVCVGGSSASSQESSDSDENISLSLYMVSFMSTLRAVRSCLDSETLAPLRFDKGRCGVDSLVRSERPDPSVSGMKVGIAGDKDPVDAVVSAGVLLEVMGDRHLRE